MDKKLNKEELTQKLLAYKGKIECCCIHVAKSETEYNTLDNYLVEVSFDEHLSISKYDDGNIRICDGKESTYIIEMDKFKEAYEYMKYKQYYFIKSHRLIVIELTNGNIIHFFFRDTQDENVIKMTGVNNTNGKGEQYPSTPKPEYIIESFSTIKHENPNNKKEE